MERIKTITFRATTDEYNKLYRFATKKKINISQAIRSLMAQDFQYLGSKSPKKETLLKDPT